MIGSIDGSGRQSEAVCGWRGAGRFCSFFLSLPFPSLSQDDMSKPFGTDDKRFKSLADVWNLPTFKLQVFVIEARGIIVGNKSQVSCSVRLERKVFGKTTGQASGDPKWGGIFWIGWDDKEMKTLVFEVFDKKAKLGEVRISLPRAPKDSLVDAWIPLKAAPEGKKKGSGQMASGDLHIRYVFSLVPETRPQMSKMIKQEFFYKKNNVQFRAGDLICYSGTGLVDTTMKLMHNSEHSQAGLVVEAANKWTGERELYVLELTFNLDETIDCFAESPRRGMVLFHLQERLHSFHGGLISHYPLRQPLTDIARADLEKTVLRVHARQEVPSVANTAATQFILKSFPFDPKRNLREFISLTGSKFIAMALMHVALLDEKSFPPPAQMTLEWLKKQPIWGQPILVRMPQENLKQVMASVRSTGSGKITQPAARPAPPQQQQQQQAPPQQAFAPVPAPNFAGNNAVAGAPVFPAQQQKVMMQQNRASGHFNPGPVGAPSAADPKLAAMEAEMRRLELEQEQANQALATQAAQLEAEARDLEAQMKASEEAMAQLQMLGDGNSDEGDDDGTLSANANLLALTGAGFDPSAFNAYN